MPLYSESVRSFDCVPAVGFEERTIFRGPDHATPVFPRTTRARACEFSTQLINDRFLTANRALILTKLSAHVLILVISRAKKL